MYIYNLDIYSLRNFLMILVLKYVNIFMKKNGNLRARRIYSWIDFVIHVAFQGNKEFQ
jgi:hypothetical protein